MALRDAVPAPWQMILPEPSKAATGRETGGEGSGNGQPNEADEAGGMRADRGG